MREKKPHGSYSTYRHPSGYPEECDASREASSASLKVSASGPSSDLYGGFAFKSLEQCDYMRAHKLGKTPTSNPARARGGRIPLITSYLSNARVDRLTPGQSRFVEGADVAVTRIKGQSAAVLGWSYVRAMSEPENCHAHQTIRLVYRRKRQIECHQVGMNLQIAFQSLRALNPIQYPGGRRKC